jgi:hypothetical protein
MMNDGSGILPGVGMLFAWVFPLLVLVTLVLSIVALWKYIRKP